MEIKTLYTQLTEAYSEESLNGITRKLISLYKGKHFGAIREIANKVSKYIAIDEERDARLFQKLINLYHPDKGASFRRSIETAFSESDFATLRTYEHILLHQNLEDFQESTVGEDTGYSPEYAWEERRNEGYYFFDEDEHDEGQVEEEGLSFYGAVKLRMYGELGISFPPYYLEDFEDFELNNCGIETLDGVEYCRHVVRLDLSENKIADISALWELNRLEELYLAGNQIGYIDSLGNLPGLRVVDLSDNQIDDISPLYELESLDYVNLINNSIPLSQIGKLRDKGVAVIF